MYTPKNPFPTPDRSIDKPYTYQFDAKTFTVALLAQGYRPYEIEKADGQIEVVWAQYDVEIVAERRVPVKTVMGSETGEYRTELVTVRHIPDLSWYAEGTVREVPIRSVSPYSTIIHRNHEGNHAPYAVSLGTAEEIEQVPV